MRKVLALTIIFICINFLTGFASTQDINQERFQIDSLKEVNQIETNQEQIVDNYNQIAYLFGGINIDSSLVYSSKGIILAKKINYLHGLAVSHSYQGRALIEAGKLKLSMENFDKALIQFSLEGDSINMLDCYSGISYLASYGSSQLKSLNYNLKALEFAEKLKDTSSLSTRYNNIGAIYKRLDNYDLALNYFQKSIDLEQKIISREQKKISKEQLAINVGSLAISYSNAGVLKVEHQKFKEAESDYQKIKSLLPKINSEYVRSYLFLSLAGYYNGINNFDSTNYYIVRARKICIENNYQHILVRVYRQQGETLLKQKQYRESIYFLDKCLNLSDSIGLHEEYPEIYKMSAEAYSHIGNHQKAYNSLLKANSAIDSLKSEKVTGFLVEFEEQKVKNEQEQQQLKLALKNQQVENTAIKMRNKFISALLAIIFLILAIVIVVFYFLKSKKNNKILKSNHKLIKKQKLLLEENIQKLEISEENLQKSNATKDIFFSIIAHDLKSPFSAILGFNDELALHYNEYSDDERMEMINHVGNASKSTYSLLENLLTWSRSQSGAIQLHKEAHQIKSLINESISPNLATAELKKINVVNNIDDTQMVWADKETIKVVVSNLFSNAIKFCNSGGVIYLSCKLNKNMLEICTRDTGIGMSEQIMDGLFNIEKNVQREGTNEEKGTGLGLILCQEFVHKNDGQIWVKSKLGEGSAMYFSLPVHQSN
ncbi:tetratricopeptide repeat-containing sensor histidine kinase [Labilibaculum antarcticum]|uniref:histidine kinase n=1 Tax=Labilibaculum antarcticum TaxID=1717717 RepID=A0A1Y1CP48_9BACT|nr:tetratricopeptide repeat-containing sensor histidine kinase [Labilibaculum antarcticum]BAX82208.1 two-component sensor histidine kinase [Labilibaculum antarcticum]